ncbi:hypothetical protein BDF19DRAFT_445976 [Syncephalis fuscata]|nr:hypothetical protein BDF19DRAFT_445976 [Syncephalis fuscata]
MAPLHTSNVEGMMVNAGIIIGIITFSGLGVLHYLRFSEKLAKGHAGLLMASILQCLQWLVLIIGGMSPHYCNAINFGIMAAIPAYYSFKWFKKMKQHQSNFRIRVVCIFVYIWITLFALSSCAQVASIAIDEFSLGSHIFKAIMFMCNAVIGTGVILIFLLNIWFLTLIPREMKRIRRTKRMQIYRLMCFSILTLLSIMSVLYIQYFIHPLFMIFYHFIALIPHSSLDEFEEAQIIYASKQYNKALAYPFAKHGIVPPSTYLPRLGRVSTLRVPAFKANRHIESLSSDTVVDYDDADDTQSELSSVETVDDREVLKGRGGATLNAIDLAYNALVSNSSSFCDNDCPVSDCGDRPVSVESIEVSVIRPNIAYNVDNLNAAAANPLKSRC